MTWILTWIVVSHFITACPEPQVVCDKFGICTQKLLCNGMLGYGRKADVAGVPY